MNAPQKAFSLLGLAAALALGLSSSPAQAQSASQIQATAPAKSSARKPAMANGLIVKFKEQVTGEAQQEATMQSMRAMAARGGLVVASERATGFNARLMRLNQRIPLNALLAIAQQMALADPTIEYVEPNAILRPHFTPNDPGFPDQWPLRDPASGIRAEKAWDLARGTGQRIAIIDSGVLPHPDLQANLLPGYDFISDPYVARDGDGRDSDASDYGNWSGAGECGIFEDATDTVWHGTHVAGIAAAVGQNALGISGVAPNAKILPVRVIGRCGADLADTVDASLWAAGFAVPGVPANPYPARILNLSLGSARSCSSSEKAAFQKIANAGGLVVVSAGNDTDDAADYSPGSCPNVVNVAAVNKSGGMAGYSNTGSVVAIAAPGGDDPDPILSTYDTGTTTRSTPIYANLKGTSMAAPHVAGVVALMASANSTLPLGVARVLMTETATTFPQACNGCGAGIVNAERAVAAAKAFVLERENNNALAQAQLLLTTDFLDIWGSINDSTTSYDDDYYLVTLPPNRKMRARLQAVSRDYDFGLSLLDRNGNLIQTSNLGGNGIDEVVTAQNATTANQYFYLKVHRGPMALRSAFQVKQYRLKITRNALSIQ